MLSGQNGNYYWLEWKSHFLYELLEAFPEIVHNNYIVITSFDSGFFQPTEEETFAGWQLLSGYACSPKITDIEMLPHDQFDEWYIFTQLPKFEKAESFINYAVFSLEDPKVTYSMETSPTIYGMTVEAWVVNRLKEQERFWTQIHAIAPQTYLAEGDFLVFVTCNIDLYNRVKAWVYSRSEV